MASTLVPGTGEPESSEQPHAPTDTDVTVPEPEPAAEPVLAPPEVRAPVPAERPTPPAELKRRRTIGLGAAIGGFVVAALLGGAVGYAAGLPQRNDLADQKDAALEQVASLNDEVTSLTDEVSAAKAAIVPVQDQLTSVQDDLATSNEKLQAAEAAVSGTNEKYEAMSVARDVCRNAAVAAEDYASQLDNLWSDLDAYSMAAPGSAAEAQLQTHINEQIQKMQDQYQAMRDSLTACQAT